MADAEFNPQSVDLDTADPRDIICYLNAGGNEYDGRLGARVSALFVILAASTATTLFPVLATRVRRLRIPLYVYLFARYFGAGVIIATAFIHLLDPAYGEIGPASCVGMTGGWAEYTWPPALALTSAMLIFLLDFLAEYYVERKYKMAHVEVEGTITSSGQGAAHTHHQGLHSADQDGAIPPLDQIQKADESANGRAPSEKPAAGDDLDIEELKDIESDSDKTAMGFQSQIAAFLILEFGVLFHSIIIGLNLGVVGDEFKTLYPVIVFHQAFEGLGIGARLSVIPFPKRFRWMPWALCLAYGLTTPIAIAIGLGVRTTYNSGSFTANVVSGILDAISAGILIYTGFVEMIARDFLFNPYRTQDKKRLAFMLVSLFLGTIIMALLGKWA
ncbi:zinc-regulated transporter 1 [Trichoderma cornu-damae]|uniref:Zinc-regulated transporter 1 n=1 Tax=Trichoderma cornu-damae TaxID=654480 RepID=A0A9P8QQJ1_9HYPO|nr:zinc-regulated transporter 1 [Trichoderma cornu-damae]